MRTALVCAMAVLVGCTNVAQMQERYAAGDQSQLPRLLEIAARPDYPYATRRKAARALGQIGDRRAVPVLTQLLFDYDQRVTLKQEALVALGRIGDTTAVAPIGRMLDLQLNEAGGELRVGALDALSRLGGPEAAGILVNALRYYDVMILRQEQMTYRGVFSGEKMDPYAMGPAGADSAGVRGLGPPRVGMFGEGAEAGAVNMFGLPTTNPLDDRNFVAEEQVAARAALVRTGPVALPVIAQFLERNQVTPSLRRDLGEIAAQIGAAAGTDSTSTPAAGQIVDPASPAAD